MAEITTCPCKNCNNRNAECHATCTAYAEWKRWRDLMASNERKSLRGMVTRSEWIRTSDGHWRNSKSRRKRK